MKVLVILENKFNDVELVTPLSCLRRADESVEIDYFNPELTSVSSQYGVITIHNVKNSVNINDYDLLFVPGGPGAQSLRTDEVSLEMIKKFPNKIAAICDAPNTLREHDIIDETIQYSAYPSSWAKEFRSNNYQQSYVTNLLSTNKLITARCADAAMQLGYELVNHFYGAEGLEKVHLAMKATK
ncbi:DJ-1/PfpI family protein [Mycoplasmopsis columboralis]|uniref:Putative intracellular protease/amidase (Putative glutaminase) n=1 Tax=Mycoplasmopsis columboralis TaxID=171282 RepID=A0A449B6T8_9BACT|nr:DJ-1/PfpI family protein [Mycoplasmopsis columboralis]VEU76272.1 putative intracellular protease/amidase (putative glutaminase) [Mycoplasmopsis columboralis]